VSELQIRGGRALGMFWYLQAVLLFPHFEIPNADFEMQFSKKICWQYCCAKEAAGQIKMPLPTKIKQPTRDVTQSKLPLGPQLETIHFSFSSVCVSHSNFTGRRL
jgi:hypothetical protein